MKRVAGARNARGTFQLTQKAAGITLKVTVLWRLQTARDMGQLTEQAAADW
jgi:hypothetical protein